MAKNKRIDKMAGPTRSYIVKVEHPLFGLCYVMTEALYHNGGREAGYRPYHAKWLGISHWWLQNTKGEIIDLTADQFRFPFPYQRGRVGGFLTKLPSKRTQKLMKVLDEIRYDK
jgi:hypothetical protein